LPVMSRPVRFFAGAPYGSGKQFISWIDSTDLSRMFLHALVSTSMQGVFNAVAPSPVNNREFIRAIGKQLHRPVWPIGVPAPVFKLLLGEQSDLVLDGQRASAEKVLAAGFKFKFDSLQASLKHHLA
jgi:NAD dependent epimerase/dehydratase family enzyme